MRAFREVSELAPQGAGRELDLDLAQVASGHRTPVLK